MLGLFLYTAFNVLEQVLEEEERQYRSILVDDGHYYTTSYIQDSGLQKICDDFRQALQVATVHGSWTKIGFPLYFVPRRRGGHLTFKREMAISWLLHSGFTRRQRDAIHVFELLIDRGLVAPVNETGARDRYTFTNRRVEEPPPSYFDSHSRTRLEVASQDANSMMDNHQEVGSALSRTGGRNVAVENAENLDTPEEEYGFFGYLNNLLDSVVECLADPPHPQLMMTQNCNVTRSQPQGANDTEAASTPRRHHASQNPHDSSAVRYTSLPPAYADDIELPDPPPYTAARSSSPCVL